MLKAVRLCKEYKAKSQNGKSIIIKAINDVSFEFEYGRSYSLVGESGSGKSTLAKLLMGLEKPSQGQILYQGNDISRLNGKALLGLRRDFKMVFQNSGSALNPRWSICDSIAEPLVNRCVLDKAQCLQRITQYINLVHLPQSVLNKRPHELSGGEQTRVCIARALITEPKFLILDESVSGLDSTIKKQILELILGLRAEIHCTYLFITHDIEAALYIADNIAVMKDGQIVEFAQNIHSLDDLHTDYSRMLVASLPNIEQILDRHQENIFITNLFAK